MNEVTIEMTDRKISSNNKRRIFRNIMTVLNILLLIAAIVIAVMVLTGCSSEPDSYPEAEAAVSDELSAIQNASDSDETLHQIAKLAGEKQDDGVDAFAGYLKKIREFDYEIMGSKKSDEPEDAVAVTARITTYDFGNAYISTWNEFLQMNESLSKENEFISYLLFKCASLTSKDFVTDVDIICTDPNGDGSWETDVKNNEALMNALSGGMVDAMKSLSEETEESSEE